MSSFEYSMFFTYHGDQIIVFHAKKYTREEVIRLARIELEVGEDVELIVTEAWVYYGFATDDDNERRNGYVLVTEKKGRAFPVLAVSKKGCGWP